MPSFGAAGKDHKKLIYNDAAFLLTLAIADGALFGFQSLDDIRKQEIPPGENELILRYNDAAVDRPVLRKYTKAKGVTGEPISKSAFLAIYESTIKNAGHLCGTSIHTIKRELGKKIDGENPLSFASLLRGTRPLGQTRLSLIG